MRAARVSPAPPCYRPRNQPGWTGSKVDIMHLRIGTRRSPLAMAQTNHVMGLIREKFPETEFTLCQIATIADRDRVSEFHQFGMVGVFAVEHEQQLVRREVDFVV